MTALSNIHFKHSELTTIIREYISTHGELTFYFHNKAETVLRIDGIYEWPRVGDSQTKTRELHEMDWEEIGLAMWAIQETLEEENLAEQAAAPDQEVRVLAMSDEQRAQAISTLRKYIDDIGARNVRSRCLLALQEVLQDQGRLDLSFFSDESVVIHELPFPQLPGAKTRIKPLIRKNLDELENYYLRLLFNRFFDSTNVKSTE